MTLQATVRVEQRLGSQMQKPGEQSWQGEKKRLSKKQQQQQQRGAGENSFPPQQHTHTAPAFQRAKKKNGEMSPKTKETTCPHPSNQEEDDSSSLLPLLTNGMGS
ncbi:hypothetical protein WISP_87606 [Willisornis vidua]|uniref:Uncharacterized protein n=1 Tax=Willisornis vidua TaxID=1566151 RepID=A0ABQ9D3N4_9PASS|nr:hypothetical protein WISP_87606 [Willisornis vidua]